MPQSPPATELNQRSSRSRSDRPCDNCRRLKQLCLITTRGEPCKTCALRRKTCTFDLPPPTRKKREPREHRVGESNHEQDTGSSRRETAPRSSSSKVRTIISCKRFTPIALAEMIVIQRQGNGWKDNQVGSLFRRLRLAKQELINYESDSSIEEDDCFLTLEPETNDPLESHFLGSGALSDFALTPLTSDLDVVTIKGLTFRQVSRDPTRPVVFVKNPSLLFGRPGDGGRAAYEEMSGRLLREVGGTGWPETLLNMYISRFLPALPFMNGVRLHLAFQNWGHGAGEFPYAELCGIMACAVHYSPQMRHLSPVFWRATLQVIDDAYRVPSLKTLQLALINVSSRPSRNHGGNSIELARAIGTARLLGLHLDSSAWRLPRWERSVRKRIWWSLVIQDKWRAILYGRPSNLYDGSSDVSLPSLRDSDWAGSGVEDQRATDSMLSFIMMCQMTLPLQKLLKAFDGLDGANSQNGYGQQWKRERKMDVLEDVNCDLKALRESLPSRLDPVASADISSRAPGVRSTQLAFLGLDILLMRFTFEIIGPREQPIGLLETAVQVCEKLVQFLESLEQDDIEGFWQPFCNSHISNGVSLLLRIALRNIPEDFVALPPPTETTDDSPYIASYRLLGRLFDVMNSSFHNFGWDIAEQVLWKSKIVLASLEQELPSFSPLLRSPALPNFPQGVSNLPQAMGSAADFPVSSERSQQPLVPIDRIPEAWESAYDRQAGADGQLDLFTDMFAFFSSQSVGVEWGGM